MIPPLGPIMLKDRISMIFLRYGHLDVIDGAFVYPAHLPEQEFPFRGTTLICSEYLDNPIL